MNETVVVFTNDEDGYYVESVCKSLEQAKEHWTIEKVISYHNFDGWKEMQEELKNPTIDLDKQFAYIQEVADDD